MAIMDLFFPPKPIPRPAPGPVAKPTVEARPPVSRPLDRS
jgi:hypothetical protein